MGELDTILGAIENIRQDNAQQNNELRKEMNTGFREFREGCSNCNIHLYRRISKQEDNLEDKLIIQKTELSDNFKSLKTDVDMIKTQQNKWLGGIAAIVAIFQFFGDVILTKLGLK